MLYLVKHTDGAYKLHQEDGTVKDTYGWTFDILSLSEDAPERQTVHDAVKQSVLNDMTDPERTAYQTMLQTTDQAITWRYRDLTLDGETVPWQPQP